MWDVFLHYGPCLSSLYLPAPPSPSTSSQPLPWSWQRSEEDGEGAGRRMLPGEWWLQVASPCGWTSHWWRKGVADYLCLLVFCGGSEGRGTPVSLLHRGLLGGGVPSSLAGAPSSPELKTRSKHILKEPASTKITCAEGSCKPEGVRQPEGSEGRQMHACALLGQGQVDDCTP